MGLLQLNLTVTSPASSLSLFPDNHRILSRTGHKNRFFHLTRKARIATSRIGCFAKVDYGSVVVREKSVSVILLAGGKGKRMGVLKDGWRIGAAVLGVPAKATIKKANSKSFVVRTLDRKTLWEMQTPQGRS